MKLLLMILICSTLFSCDLINNVEKEAARINAYEKKSLILAKSNRELKNELSHLNYKIQQLESENSYLKLQLKESKKSGRTIASISPYKGKSLVGTEKDLVKFSVYKWSAADLLKTADKEFEKRNFSKASQFYSALVKNYPKYKGMSDIVLFQAGLANYEAGNNYNESVAHFKKLIGRYPSSKFYRGAKLWSALAYLKMGNQDQFFSTVEEFREKYRNTPEWKILSDKYEEIVENYKN